jgi:hypothetical protein
MDPQTVPLQIAPPPPIPAELIWSGAEAAAINEFLGSPLGRKWLGLLLNRKPRIVFDKGLEAAALSGAFSSGYEQFFMEIAASRHVAPSAEVNIKPVDMTRD